MTKTSKTFTFGAMLAGLTLAAGCATSGYTRADKTGAGIAEYRAEIVNGQKAINDTVVALDGVAASANTDPRPAFEKFSKSVANLESVAAKVKKRGEAMQQSGKTYFAEWEKQLAEVNNEEIRKLAAERKAKLSAAFDSIKEYADPLRAQFAPWMSDLKDLHKFLGNDLTIAGVDSAKGLFKKAQSQGTDVQKSMDALVAELNTIEAAITPAKVAPKK
jgi:hypothetical protein